MTEPTQPRNSLPRLWSATSWRDPAMWLGPAITIAVLALVVLIRPAVTISSPGIPLLVTIAASAALGGLRSGLLSAAVTVVFVALDASAPGQLFSYDASGTSRLVLNASAAIAMAILVGWIRARLDAERDRVAAQRAAEHQRAFTDTASDAMITIDARGRIESANPAAGRMFGYDADALLGRIVEDLLAPAIREPTAQARVRYLKTGQRTMNWGNTAFIGARRDGSEFPIEVSLGEFAVDRQRYFTWIIRDVSERRALEDQLAQAQKMEAIGQLAGGVAHDFNNMLTAIGGFAELMAEDDDDPVGRHHAIDGIRSATERAAGLTRQLLAFSRRQHLEPRIVSLNETLTRIEPLLRRLLGEHVTLVTHQADDLWPVLADPSQLETVVMNLAINGRDAMPDGGTLTIETLNVELDEIYAHNHVSVAPGSYAMLAVNDTGAGMDQETLIHIFEPFYTTKAVGRGTGLGLSSAYGVVRQSGGNIWVYSEPGKGTTFKIYLPRAEGVMTGGLADAKDLLAVGSERILIAEDEPVVRDLILTTLRRYGYSVLAAADGREALAILEREATGIDLLVSDVVMPNLGGLELLELARVKRPSLPVILISGYSEKLLPADSLAGDVMLLEKPFTARQLTDAIRRALGDGVAPA